MTLAALLADTPGGLKKLHVVWPGGVVGTLHGEDEGILNEGIVDSTATLARCTPPSAEDARLEPATEATSSPVYDSETPRLPATASGCGGLERCVFLTHKKGCCVHD